MSSEYRFMLVAAFAVISLLFFGVIVTATATAMAEDTYRAELDACAQSDDVIACLEVISR